MVGMRPLFRTPLLAIGLSHCWRIRDHRPGRRSASALQTPPCSPAPGWFSAASRVPARGAGGPARRPPDPEWFLAPAVRGGDGVGRNDAGCLVFVAARSREGGTGLVPAGIAFALTPIGVGESCGSTRATGSAAKTSVSDVAWVVVRRTGSRSEPRGHRVRAVPRPRPRRARALADPLVARRGRRPPGRPCRCLSGTVPVATPALDALVADGLAFDNVVSPVPMTGPAQAALMTGRHPVRAGVMEPTDRLLRGYLTVAEVFGKEGYATGGFVSSPASGGRGLSRLRGLG